MSEEQNNKDLPVAETEKDEVKALPTEEKKVFSRRQALLGALFGAGAVLAKTAKAAEASCACLAPPDCDSICANGGTPRGDGTQACDCNAEAKETLAKVAYTGSYEDLTNKPTIPDVSSLTLQEVGTAGNVGPTGDVTINEASIGQIKIPYFTVNKYGQVTAKGERTLKVSTGNYYNYYNYGNYYDCGDMN